MSSSKRWPSFLILIAAVVGCGPAGRGPLKEKSSPRTKSEKTASPNESETVLDGGSDEGSDLFPDLGDEPFVAGVATFCDAAKTLEHQDLVRAFCEDGQKEVLTSVDALYQGGDQARFQIEVSEANGVSHFTVFSSMALERTTAEQYFTMARLQVFEPGTFMTLPSPGDAFVPQKNTRITSGGGTGATTSYSYHNDRYESEDAVVAFEAKVVASELEPGINFALTTTLTRAVEGITGLSGITIISRHGKGCRVFTLTRQAIENQGYPEEAERRVKASLFEEQQRAYLNGTKAKGLAK